MNPQGHCESILGGPRRKYFRSKIKINHVQKLRVLMKVNMDESEIIGQLYSLLYLYSCTCSTVNMYQS